jgi:dihydrofolate synthase/folylpolyglutamate synthase
MAFTQEPDDILELFGKRLTVIKPGLERVRYAWQSIGSPSKQIPTILVGGTNGKGSTSGILWRLLAQSGFKVGFFSSPHLVEFRERFALSHRSVHNKEIIDIIHELKSLLQNNLWDELSFFEITTLVALKLFESEPLDAVVLEVGMGGRLDCTNIVDPVLSVITNVGLDHEAWLGNTTAKIAAEKAGIMRSNAVCLWGGDRMSDLNADGMIRDTARALGCRLAIFGQECLELSSHDFKITHIEDTLHLNYPKVVKGWPAYLRVNFVMAVQALTLYLVEQEKHEVKAAVARAVACFDDVGGPCPTTLNGRFQRVLVTKGDVTRRFIIDVCHNPHGASAFANGLVETGVLGASNRAPAFMSILNDKDVSGIWSALKGRISRTKLFKSQSERTWSSTQQVVPGMMYPQFEHAFTSALEDPSWICEPVWIVCGSVAAVGDVFKYFDSAGWRVLDELRG